MNRIGFYTLIGREYYRFARLSKQTVFPPVLTTLLFVLIFGFSLGSKIREIHGFSYIVFILPGLAAMGVLTNSYANTSTSLYMTRLDRSIENILAAPLSSLMIVTAFVIGGLMRGVIIGVVTLLIAYLCVPMPFPHLGWSILVIVLSSITFSSLGILSALWAESWDHIATFTNFFITPFVYLGGVFYSVQMLPPFWHRVSLFNPIFYAVDALRWGTIGVGDLPFWIPLSALSAAALLSFGACVLLFKRGYKLIA